MAHTQDPGEELAKDLLIWCKSCLLPFYQVLEISISPILSTQIFSLVIYYIWKDTLNSSRITLQLIL